MAVTVGLDIGGTAVRAAVLDSAKSRWVLRRFAEMPLPPGAVTAGEIVDEGAVSEALSALWRRAKLPKRRIVVGLASQRLVVRQVDVPNLGPEELAEALPYQVQDSIPLAVDEAVLDYVPLEDFMTEEGDAMQSILAIAVHREIVEAVMRVLHDARLTPAAIDLQPFGLVRAVFGIEPGVGSPLQALVDIGASVTQLAVTRGGTARFVRLLPRGGDDFTAALVEHLEIEPDEAADLKARIGVRSEGMPGDQDPDAEAQRILTQKADELIDDIRGSIDFFLTQTEGAALERLVVAGNGARLPHLANRMARLMGVQVEPAKILDVVEVGRVDLGDDEMLEAQPVIPTALGLALWGEV
ncbi:MAG: type IV pilus assembly protein PilM [Acidimicrobiia bacterium]|jgi:type IV pilus assembly protein PilM